jgi:hypothetical protein
VPKPLRARQYSSRKPGPIERTHSANHTLSKKVRASLDDLFGRLEEFESRPRRL